MVIDQINIQEYNPKSSDVFFFDNNVWIHIYGALSNYNKRKQKIFSNFLKEIQTAGATIVTSSMILSEFANSYLRFTFHRWQKENGFLDAKYKKDYVGSDSYKESATEVTSYLKRILKITEKYPDDFNAINLDNVLERLSFIDFNDSYILELATKNRFKIVTDDNDFVDYDIHSAKVITLQQ